MVRSASRTEPVGSTKMGSWRVLEIFRKGTIIQSQSPPYGLPWLTKKVVDFNRSDTSSNPATGRLAKWIFSSNIDTAYRSCCLFTRFYAFKIRRPSINQVEDLPVGSNYACDTTVAGRCGVMAPFRGKHVNRRLLCHHYCRCCGTYVGVG